MKNMDVIKVHCGMLPCRPKLASVLTNQTTIKLYCAFNYLSNNTETVYMFVCFLLVILLQKAIRKPGRCRHISFYCQLSEG